MASGRTENYQLNQWEPSDPVLREEFNADNAKIDGIMGDIPKIVVGTYTGDGAETRTIELGFMPRAVYLCKNNGATYESGRIWGGLAVAGSPLVEEYGSDRCQALAVAPGGFQVGDVSIGYRWASTNANQTTYHYLAVG